MSPRVFLFLLVVTVAAIWVVAASYAAPGLERTLSVLVVAAAIVGPAAWLLGRLGYIRKGNVELGRRREPSPGRSDGGAA